MGFHNLRVQSQNRNLTSERKKSKNAEDVPKKLKLIAIRKVNYEAREYIEGDEYALIHEIKCGTTFLRALVNCGTKAQYVAFVRTLRTGKEVELVRAGAMPHILRMVVTLETPVKDLAEAVDICMKQNLELVSVELISHKAKLQAEAEVEEGDDDE